MLPPATLPGAAAVRHAAWPGRDAGCAAGAAPGSGRRDAEAGLAEVMAMPAIWKDAGGRLAELPGAGGGSWRAGRCRARRPPEPAWTAEQLAAAGVAEEPGPVREGTGLGLASAVLTPALLDEALAGVPARRPRKITPRLAMQVEPGAGADARDGCGDAAAAGAAAPGSRPGHMTCRRRRRCRTRTASCRSGRSCGCWPGCAGRSARSRCPASRRRACRRRGRRAGTRTAVRLRPAGRRAGRGGRAAGTGCGCWPRTAPSARSPTRRAADRKGTGGQSRNAAHFGRPASTGAPAAPQVRMVEVTDVWCARRGGLGGRALRHRGDHPRRAPRTRLRAR